MINVRQGDLLSATGIIVHGCNMRGVMGAGVAKAVKAKWPKVYAAYRHAFDTKGLSLGEIIPVVVADGVIVVNAITQNGTARYPGEVMVDYPAIATAFLAVNALAKETGIDMVNFPLIGCGLAGGDWDKVAPLISTSLSAGIRTTLWTL